MTKRQLEQLKKETQEQVDQIVPGKVKVSIEKDGEDRGGNTYILIGEYDYHTMLINVGGKICTTKSTWTERIDNFFTDNKLFLAFFKQRRDYMMATLEEQLAFDGHPAEYKAIPCSLEQDIEWAMESENLV